MIHRSWVFFMLVACGAPTVQAVDASTTLDAAGFAVTIGDEEQIVAPNTPGLLFFPDEHISYLRQPDGTYHMWTTSTAATVEFRTPDLAALGAPTVVLAPVGGADAFDADYAGGGSVFPAANGSDLLMLYHAENHTFGGVHSVGIPFYASIGLARSTDGGAHWIRQGQVIAGSPKQDSQTDGGAGAMTPSAVLHDGYVYAVFREIDPQTHTSGLCLARAAVASDGAPGSWRKLYSGLFTEAGLGGMCTPLTIELDPSDENDRRQPGLSYNAFLHAFLLSVVGNGGIYFSTSPDLLTWSVGKLGLPAPVPDGTVMPATSPYNWYPTLLSLDEPTDEATTASGFLYYAKGNDDGTSRHSMFRRPFTLILVGK